MRKTVLRLPDLDHAKTAVLNSLSSPRSRRNYKFAMEQFIEWCCSEPRLAPGTFGNTGSGTLRGPGNLTVDASAFKAIPVTERINLQIRAEAFNVINCANYVNPGSTVASAATYGIITVAGSPRVLHFALRALF